MSLIFDGTLNTIAGANVANTQIVGTITNAQLGTLSTLPISGGTLTLPASTGTLLSNANPQSGGVIQTVSAYVIGDTSTTSTTCNSKLGVDDSL